MFSFASAALTAGFLEADIIAAYDRALQRNHARATDCQAIWDNGSTVSEARVVLARTSRRFELGQVDPRDHPQGPGEPALGIRFGQTERSRRDVNHGAAWQSLSDAMIADQATPTTATSALTVAGFRASLDPFRLSANRRWRPLDPLVRISRQVPQSSSDPQDFQAQRSFPRPRSDGIALLPREVPGGSLVALLALLPFACQARCGRPRLRLVS